MNDRIEAAFTTGEPIAALRSLAIELSKAGHSRRHIYNLFHAKYVELQSAGREAEEHILGDVMDMIMDEYPPHNLRLPG